jgi:hypothetical protein
MENRTFDSAFLSTSPTRFNSSGTPDLEVKYRHAERSFRCDYVTLGTAPVFVIEDVNDEYRLPARASLS